jgi:acyl-CoA thioesterase I
MISKFLLSLLVVLHFQSASEKTILFFGDSLTAGYGLTEEEAFPALIEKSLKEKGKKVRVINSGSSGETSAGGLTRIDWVLRQPVDIFILELGANDGLRGVPLEETKKNLQAIVDKVKSKNKNVKIVVAGMMVPPNMGKTYSDGFQKIFPELAKKNNATLIPFLLEGVAGDEKLNQADGIHPTVEGHKIVAVNVGKVLEKLL